MVDGGELRNGHLVGAYRVLHQIGAGGMGSVYLAEHTTLGRRAAIKVLHAQYSTRGDTVTRFFNEARAATSINDPGIVQIFDYGIHSDGSAYIVMELLEGEPLDLRLQRGPLPVTSALRIIRQVASALGAAHALGIVHRDLKPENIFLVRDAEVTGGERAKILDFGIAKLAATGAGIKTQTSTLMGTPMYMSPEQCRGAGQVDQRSDIYALGCVLFTLLAGRPPFDADGIGEIIAQHLREPAPAPSRFRTGIPDVVDQLVLRCLEKDPTSRYASARDLVVALAVLLGSSPDTTNEPPHTTLVITAASAPTTLSAGAAESGPQPRRSRSTSGGIFIGLLGLIVAIVAAVEKIEVASPPANTVAPSTPAEPVRVTSKPSAPTRVTSTAEAVTPTMRTTIARFKKWSELHASATCPAASTFESPVDPWNHVLRVTCTDQPGDQIIGVISDGPDGEAGTNDDVASWHLGREITELVRGPRWQPVAAPPPEPKHRAKKAPTATTEPTIGFDDNGIPLSQ